MSGSFSLTASCSCCYLATRAAEEIRKEKKWAAKFQQHCSRRTVTTLATFVRMIGYKQMYRYRNCGQLKTKKNFRCPLKRGKDFSSHSGRGLQKNHILETVAMLTIWVTHHLTKNCFCIYPRKIICQLGMSLKAADFIHCPISLITTTKRNVKLVGFVAIADI